MDLRSGDERQRVIIDFVQAGIETYNQELGGGVAVRKDRGGYTLIREDIGIPLARLRPNAEKGGRASRCFAGAEAATAWRPIGEWASPCKAWMKPSNTSPPTRWIASGREDRAGQWSMKPTTVGPASETNRTWRCFWSIAIGRARFLRRCFGQPRRRLRARREVRIAAVDDQ